MPAIINYKRCDRGRGCPCIKTCESNAFVWSEAKKRPEVDISKCTSCAQCIKACPARATLFAYNMDGLKKLAEEIKASPGIESEVFEPRFGADPLDAKLLVNDFDLEVLGSKEPVLVEFSDMRCTSRCRANSPLYSSIIPKGAKVKIMQVDILENPDLAEKYGVLTAPSIVVFKNGRIVDYLAGCSSIADIEVLKERVKKALL